MADNINLAAGVLIQPQQTTQKVIAIRVLTRPDGNSAYELEPQGFMAPDQAMMSHEIIMHLLEVVKNLNGQLAIAHEQMIGFMQQEQVIRPIVQRN